MAYFTGPGADFVRFIIECQWPRERRGMRPFDSFPDFREEWFVTPAVEDDRHPFGAPYPIVLYDLHQPHTFSDLTWLHIGAVNGSINVYRSAQLPHDRSSAGRGFRASTADKRNGRACRPETYWTSRAFGSSNLDALLVATAAPAEFAYSHDVFWSNLADRGTPESLEPIRRPPISATTRRQSTYQEQEE